MRTLQLLCTTLLLSVGLWAGDSPLSGTWKFNPSKGHPIQPVMKSSTAHVAADEEKLKLNQDFVDDKGQSSTVTFEAKFDGKDYPVSGDPTISTVSIRRVNDHEVILSLKKDGKLVGKNKVTVSKDGKTTTCNVTQYSEGKRTSGTYIYDKE